MRKTRQKRNQKLTYVDFRKDNLKELIKNIIGMALSMALLIITYLDTTIPSPLLLRITSVLFIIAMAIKSIPTIYYLTLSGKKYHRIFHD